MTLPHPELIMVIQPKIINHLGINMYTNLHAVISELIANSWDADANNVYITIPEGKVVDRFQISIKDDGNGMNFDDLNNMYLQVGRNKRGINNDLKTPSGRIVLGRKGIGKFAVFGVAKKVLIRSVKDHEFTEFRMDIENIKNVNGESYKPEIIGSGKTDEINGVIVTLIELKRKNAINISLLRQGLANRFLFIENGINIFLNDLPITADDIKVEDIEYTWNIDDAVSDSHPDWKITGTIWSKMGTIRELHNRGVALYARQKLVQEPTFFEATSGKEYAYPHIFGKLTADFLDGENDIIGTNRSSINWESEEGEAIQVWGNKKLTDISIEWSKKRVAERTEKVKESPDFSEWFDDLNTIDQQRATKVFNSITRNDNLSDEKIFDLAGYVRDIFKFDAFQELSHKIEEAPTDDVEKVIELFRDWEHLEASEMYRIMKGRISTINKLERFIKSDAKEVPTIHEYIKKFPWILDPRWQVVYDEVKFSKLLRKEFPDKDKPLKDRRIDFLCFQAWPSIIVVELKRPGLAVGKKELEQLREYCIFMEEHKGGTDPSYSNLHVFGYLICENEQQNIGYGIRKTKLAEQNMFVRKYSELLTISRKINDDIIQKYQEVKDLSKRTP